MNDLEQLSTLDPMRDFEPSPERRARATAALEQTFANHQEGVANHQGFGNQEGVGNHPGLGHRQGHANHPGLGSHQGFDRHQVFGKRRVVSTPRRLVLGGVVAAAVGAVALSAMLLVPGPESNRAYAWTATPQAAEGADVLPLAQQCAKGWTDWTTPPTAADILLAEKRGKATLLLVAKGRDDLTSCLVLDPDQGPAGAELLDNKTPAPPAGQVRTESMGATEGDEGWYSEVIGRAGAGVTKVEIELPDGTEVRASLRDGWWAAWWPGHEGGEADGVRVVAHTS